jgi:hypothetical protein
MQKSVQQMTPGGKTVERPVSPHVTIYSMPPTAITSIVHRVAGVGMTAGANDDTNATMDCSVTQCRRSIRIGIPLT